jgi:hypothetical protein
MRKLSLLLFIFVLSFISVLSANFIDVQVQNGLSCNEWNVSIYLDEDNDNDGYHDKDIYLNSNFEYSETNPPTFQAVHIRNNDSKVQYKIPESNMLYSMKSGIVSNFDNTLFNRAALAFPYNTWVRWMDSYPNKVAFEQPQNNISNNFAIINYHYVYKLANSFASNSNYSYWYNQPANYLDHSNNVTYCTLGSTPSPCSSSWSYKERSWFSTTNTKNTCTQFDLYWCGDGVLQSSSQNFDFGDSSEQCDPNDSSQQGWGNGWCSNTCTPINYTPAPTCTLNVISVPNGSYDVYWSINGTFNSPTQISITPTTVNQTTYSVTNSNGTWTNIVPTWIGTYTASMTVSNAGWSNTCYDTFVVNPPSAVCGDGNIDSPNSNWVYEECDNWPSFGNGCDSSCQLMTPSCSLTVNKPVQLLWNSVTFSANKDPWATYQTFDLWNSFVLYTWNINFSYNYVYSSLGTYNSSILVENNHSPIASGISRPTSTCSTQVEISKGCEIDIVPNSINIWDVANISWTIWPSFNTPAYMNVSPSLTLSWPYPINYSTWNINVGPNISNTWQYVFSINSNTIYWDAFSCTWVLNVGQIPYTGELNIDKILLTTWNLLPWDMVEYQIVLENIWSGIFYDAYISDVLPDSLTLVSHNLTWISNYTNSFYQDSYWDWVLEYTWFDLNPGQSVTLYISWTVNNGALSSQTTNCAFTSWDYDCVIYNLATLPDIIKYQSMSNWSVSIPFTTWNISVNLWDYIIYKLEFGNYWWADTVWGVSIVDVLPTCVDYVSASIYGVVWASFNQTQNINGNRNLEYNWFNLTAGQTGYIIITWQIISSTLCDTYNTYQNDAYIYFYNPLQTAQDSVIANKANQSVVDITKTSNVHDHLPWDNKTFEINVYNYGPNTIDNIELEDIWPAGNCINYSDRTWAGFTKDPNTLVWYANSPLLAWDSLTLYISWYITNSQTCVNPNYENIVNLEYTEAWVQYTDSAVYNFSVSPTPFANISLIKTANKSIVSQWDTIEYTIVYQNVWNTRLNSYVITDYWPWMIDFVSANPFPSSTVNLSTWSILTWNFNSYLNPWETWQIIVEGIVK